MRILLGFAVLATIASPPAADAGPVDLAEHFPANSPLYFEVRRPEALGAELGAAFRGTVLEDSFAAMNRLHDRQKQPRSQPVDTTQLGVIGALFGPEMLSEVKRFEGFAVGVTGFSKAQEPCIAAVLATGDSHLPGLAIRAFVTASQGMRRIATVEGVDLYQEMSNPVAQETDGPVPANGAPATPQPVPTGSVYAYSPGRVIIASDKTAAAAVIRRWKGKDSSPSLASATGFTAFRTVRESSLAFAFAEPRPWLAIADAPERRRRHDSDSPARAILQELLRPDSMRGIAVGWKVNRDAYCLQLEAHLEPAHFGPVFELLTGATEKQPVFAVTAPEGALQLSVAFGDPAGRGNRLVRFVDAIARGAGTIGITPGEAVQELDRQAHLKVGAEFLDKVIGATIALPPPQAWPKQGWPWPTIVLHTESPAAATLAAKAVPLLLRVAGARSTDPTAETISGIKVYSVPGDGLNGPASIHFATHGADFAVGADRALVAGVFGGVNKTLRGKEDPTRNCQVNLVAPWQSILRSLLGVTPPDPTATAQRPGIDGSAPMTPVAADARGALRNASDDLLRALGSLPPVVGSVRREGATIRAELRQPDARDYLRKVVDKCVEWASRVLDTDGESAVAPGTGPTPSVPTVDR